MITKEFTQFFEELAVNNNREWFLENKKKYEETVKKPFMELIQGVLEKLPAGQGYPVDPKETLFRINRDVRFSTDKTPYHTLIKASIVQGGKKSERPGIYLAADAETFRVGGGLAMIHPKKLKAVRQFVADHIDELIALTRAKPFSSLFPELKGEQYKKADTIAQSAGVETPLLLHKQFYYMASYPIKDYYEKDMIPVVMQHIEAAKKLNRFLTEALDFASK